MVHTATFDFSGHQFLGDVTGALYWCSLATLIVSDLHFEKGSAFAHKQRRHIPPYDTRETLCSLQTVIERYRPQRVICLGDSFHDRDSAQRMGAEDRIVLQNLSRAQEWIWITGNHDPFISDWAGGDVAEILTMEGIVFRHQAEQGAIGEISGHYHPKASVIVANNRASGKCFAFDDRRMIMPAFGAFTGGLNVLDSAISDLFQAEFTAAIIGRQRVACIPRRKLVV